MTKLSKEQLEELGSYLEEKLQFTFPSGDITIKNIGSVTWKYDGTTKHTQEWLSAKGLPVEEYLSFLEEVGGWCDCEVYWNVCGSE